MEKVLLFVEPGVESYLHRIEKMKGMIRHMLDIALIDFLTVSSVFKKYNQFADPSMSGEDASRVSMSVKELQYMDTFSQKLDHILRLNQGICEASHQPNFTDKKNDHAGFIFRLNHMQAAVAVDEFLMNATDLRKNLHELHDHIISVTKLDYHESGYFKHLAEIEIIAQELIHLMDEMQRERYREAPITVTNIESEMKKISDLYTMTSERFVLLWLLKHTHSSADELLQQYKQEGYEQVEEEIELF